MLWDRKKGRTDDYEVGNFGVSGRTMMKSGDHPYWDEDAYQQALAFEPDIVLIMLGSNDSKRFQWDEEAYMADYAEFIGTFKALDSNPDVYLLLPTPVYIDGTYAMDQYIVNERFPEIYPIIA